MKIEKLFWLFELKSGHFVSYNEAHPEDGSMFLYSQTTDMTDAYKVSVETRSLPSYIKEIERYTGYKIVKTPKMKVSYELS